MFTVAVFRFGLSLPLATTSLMFELAVMLLFCRLAVSSQAVKPITNKAIKSLTVGIKFRAYRKGQNGDVLPRCRTGNNRIMEIPQELRLDALQGAPSI